MDDAERPEQECFPLRLQELCKETNIIGANVNDSGKNNAALKVIAHMHGLKLEELESEERRRQKKRNMISAVAAAALLAALGFAGYAGWDYYVPKYAYYVDYTEVYGLPKGIGDLTKEETKSIYAFYTIVTRCGKIQELRHENSYGKLMKHELVKNADRPVLARYDYLQDGTLAKITYYDVYDNPKEVRNYNANLTTVDIKKYVEKGSSAFDSAQPMNASTVSILKNTENENDHKNNVVRHLITNWKSAASGMSGTSWAG